MFYLSERLGYAVHDANDQVVGHLGDLILAPESDAVAAIVVKTAGRGSVALPMGLVGHSGPRRLHLSGVAPSWPLYTSQEGEIWLARDVLDHRAVDARRAKLVRVNAIVLDDSAGQWRVKGVEVGTRGLLQRLGLSGLADRLRLPHELVAWNDLALTQGRPRPLEQMHPAEIASVVENLPPAQGSDLVEALTDEVAAETLEEVHPDRQADLLEDMPPERAADILEEMAPDEAADVLQDMTEEKAQELLGLMDKEEAAEAKELLAHAEDSAGGIMTTEYATLPPHLTATEALSELRRRYAGEIDDFHYVYITDAEEHLLGVTSLWDLVMAAPENRLADFMETKVVSVRPEQDAEEAARLISKYGILAIPVVDAENHLQGVVTVDDAMDLILPEEWRGRLPHMY